MEAVGAHAVRWTPHSMTGPLPTEPPPYLLAAALVRTGREAAGCAPNAGQNGGKRLSRHLPPRRERSADDADILLTNRKAIEAALESFERQLAWCGGCWTTEAWAEEWMEKAQRERRAMFV